VGESREGDEDGKQGADLPIDDDDAAFLRAFQERAREVENLQKERERIIDRNWREGKAEVKLGAVVNDWVRRVILAEDELFVGTASRGVQRYRLGADHPRQVFAVKGDPSRSVRADHPAEVDPETSVTSIAWNGRCLFAGLAGGRVHVWKEDGSLLLDVAVCPRDAYTRPCYVHVSGNMLIAAAGTSVMRWDIQELDAQPHTVQVTSNIHCLAPGFEGSFALGLEDGTVELRSLQRLALLCRRPAAHRYAVSAVHWTSVGFLSGDADGNLVCWRADAATPGEDWEKIWMRHHDGRVVAISVGGGNSVVTAALDSFIRVWDAESGVFMFAIPEHRVWLGSVSVSADYDLMATDGKDNAVFIYRFSD